MSIISAVVPVLSPIDIVGISIVEYIGFICVDIPEKYYVSYS